MSKSHFEQICWISDIHQKCTFIVFQKFENPSLYNGRIYIERSTSGSNPNSWNGSIEKSIEFKDIPASRDYLLKQLGEMGSDGFLTTLTSALSEGESKFIYKKETASETKYVSKGGSCYEAILESVEAGSDYEIDSRSSEIDLVAECKILESAGPWGFRHFWAISTIGIYYSDALAKEMRKKIDLEGDPEEPIPINEPIEMFETNSEGDLILGLRKDSNDIGNIINAFQMSGAKEYNFEDNDRIHPNQFIAVALLEDDWNPESSFLDSDNYAKKTIRIKAGPAKNILAYIGESFLFNEPFDMQGIVVFSTEEEMVREMNFARKEITPQVQGP